MRRLLLSAILLLAIPAAASARWGEAPATDVGATGIATCLRDAGGGRVASDALAGGGQGVALHTVTAKGLRPRWRGAGGRAMFTWTSASAQVSARVHGGVAVAAGSRFTPSAALGSPVRDVDALVGVRATAPGGRDVGQTAVTAGPARRMAFSRSSAGRAAPASREAGRRATPPGTATATAASGSACGTPPACAGWCCGPCRWIRRRGTPEWLCPCSSGARA